MARFGPKPGRKPKAPNFGRLPSGSALEKQPATGAPSCPASLTPAQKTVFRTTVNELAATKGWLQPADRAVLRAFAIHTVNFLNAQKHRDLEGDVLDTCDKHGEVGQKTSQWVFIAQKESMMAMQAGDRLGLNPSSRETLHVEPPKQFGVFDPLRPPDPFRAPKSTPPYNVLKERERLTQTVYQRETVTSSSPDLVPVVGNDPPAGAVVEGQAAHVIEVQPDPVDQDPVVPQDIEQPVPVATVEPDPTETQPDDVQPHSDDLAETPVKKKTVNWPFPRVP